MYVSVTVVDVVKVPPVTVSVVDSVDQTVSVNVSVSVTTTILSARTFTVPDNKTMNMASIKILINNLFRIKTSTSSLQFLLLDM